MVDPNHSTFYYFYLNKNSIFNQKTYDYISARVFPSPIKGCVQLSTANGFINAYKQLITSIKYQLGNDDKSFLRKHIELQKKQSKKIIKNYETTFDSITSQQITIANQKLKPYKITIDSKLDYILMYRLAYTWSDSKNNKKPPLSFYEMVHTASLDTLFTNLPASATLLLPDIFLYFEYFKDILILEKNVRYNSMTLSNALKNTRIPNSSNGGLKTFNTIDGEVYSFSPAYALGNSQAGIVNGLNDTLRTIKISIDIPLKSKSGERMIFQSNTNKKITSFELDDILKIKIEYKGYIFIPVSPLSYLENKLDSSNNTSQPNSWGWYFEEAIKQASNNKNCEQTGYCFLIPPSYNLGSLNQGGNFGRITGLLIANPPTISILFNQKNSALSLLKKSYTEGTLQIPFAQIKGNYFPRRNSKKNTNEIIFTPKNTVQVIINSSKPLQKISIPENSKIAQVLMIAVSYPSD